MVNAMGVDTFPMKPSLLSPTEVLDEVIDMAKPPARRVLPRDLP